MSESTSADNVFLRENQRVSSSEILQALASGQAIKLLRCTVSGELDCNRLLLNEESFDLANMAIAEEGERRILTLSQPVLFRECTFEGDVCFGPPWEKPNTLKILFEQDVVFNLSVFCGQTRFSETEFRGLAGFDGCSFQRVASFTQAQFCGRTMFRTCWFEGYGLFNEARFFADSRFTNTSFSKGANFTRVRFENRADFAGVYSRSKSVPITGGIVFARKRFGDEETFWRFIKQTCQEAGHYQQAGDCFYEERCASFWGRFRGANYEQLSLGRKFRRCLAGFRLLPELILVRWLFGYGERPIRVLLAALLVIFLCGVYYSSDAAHIIYRENPEYQFHFLDGLYFSTVTFTTLGLGDIYPERADTLTRMITMAEALSGACLMALFIVSLSKRFSRG